MRCPHCLEPVERFALYITVTCPECTRDFSVLESQARYRRKRSGVIYCSGSCAKRKQMRDRWAAKRAGIGTTGTQS